MTTTVSIVRNVNNPDIEHIFTLPQRESVIASFALYTMGDANEWDWEKKYRNKAVRGKYGWHLNDWTALDIEAKLNKQ